jgi:outer membrane protein assembly factor BamB
VKKKEVDKARLACETELTLLHESVEEVDVLLGSSKNDVDELNRLTGVKVDFVSKINEYEKLLNDVNFVANALYENTPLPSDTKLAEVINEYKVVSEALELHRTNIVSSLNNKGIVIPSDTKLSGVPEQILKLPTLGGGLTINSPNVGAMIDTKDSEYDVTNINNVHSYPDANNRWTLTWTYYNHTDYLRALVVNKDGFIYSGDDKWELHKTNPNGEKVWAVNLNGGFIMHLAIDDDGFVYAALRNNKVVKVNPNGETLWTYTGHTASVNCVAIGKGGFVYSCSDDGTVKKISPDGVGVWSFANRDALNVSALAVDSNNFIYFGDSKGIIVKIDSDKNFIWDSKSTGIMTRSIAVDSEDNICVSDISFTVRKLSPNSDLIWSYGHNTSDINGVVFDKDDYVYFCSAGGGNSSIIKLTPSGELVYGFKINSNDVFSIGIDNNKYIYVCDKQNLYKISDNYVKSINMDLKRR